MAHTTPHEKAARVCDYQTALVAVAAARAIERTAAIARDCDPATIPWDTIVAAWRTWQCAWERTSAAIDVLAAARTALIAYDPRVRTFFSWADEGTVAWRMLLATILAESPQTFFDL